MPGNSFGTILRVTTWGESHGPAVGVVVDGCPAGLNLSEKDIQPELDRRRPGQNALTTARKEADIVRILSGVFKEKTTGTPISLLVKNKGQQSGDYKESFRPGHADEVYKLKYGFWDFRGGGRASARETVGRVAAGAIAKKLLKGTKFSAHITQVGDLATTDFKKITAEILKAKKAGKSIGGTIECVIKKPPAGLGSPVFNKLGARLAQASLSIPASRGFELINGISGGISNGKDIVFRVAFKAPGTIGKRHDPCVLHRALPIVEAMAALVLADEAMIQKTVRL